MWRANLNFNHVQEANKLHNVKSKQNNDNQAVAAVSTKQ